MKNFFTFVAGLVIGSAVTYVVVKDKFEKIAQEEIDSVKEVFGRRVEKEADKKVEKIAEKEVEKIRKEYNEYNNLTKNYTNYSKTEAKEDEVDEENEEVCENDEEGVELFEVERASDSDRPYVIDPWDFGGEDGYDMITLNYYADDVLTDDNDNVIDDEEIDDIVGRDFAEHFGEYEKDCVCVRNDRLKTDYEICRDLVKYSTLLLNPNNRN
jgi:hypothetical protein